MQIRFKFRGVCYSLDIGRHTPWFDQIWLVSFSKETWEYGTVMYARILFTFGEKK